MGRADRDSRTRGRGCANAPACGAAFKKDRRERMPNRMKSKSKPALAAAVSTLAMSLGISPVCASAQGSPDQTTSTQQKSEQIKAEQFKANQYKSQQYKSEQLKS